MPDDAAAVSRVPQLLDRLIALLARPPASQEEADQIYLAGSALHKVAVNSSHAASKLAWTSKLLSLADRLAAVDCALSRTSPLPGLPVLQPLVGGACLAVMGMNCILTPLEARLPPNDALRMLGGSLPLLFHWGRRLVGLWMERAGSGAGGGSSGGGNTARRAAPNSAAPSQRPAFPSGYDPKLLGEAACNQLAVVCAVIQQIVRVGGSSLLATWSRTPSGRPSELLAWLAAVADALLLVLLPGHSLQLFRGANIVIMCNLLFQADILPQYCAALGAEPHAQRALVRLLLQYVLPTLGPALTALTAAPASGGAAGFQQAAGLTALTGAPASGGAGFQLQGFQPQGTLSDDPALIVVRLLASALQHVVSSGLTEASTTSNSPSVQQFLACLQATYGDDGVLRSAERAAAALPLVRPEAWEPVLFARAHLGSSQLLALLSDVVLGMVSEQGRAGGGAGQHDAAVTSVLRMAALVAAEARALAADGQCTEVLLGGVGAACVSVFVAADKPAIKHERRLSEWAAAADAGLRLLPLFTPQRAAAWARRDDNAAVLPAVLLRMWVTGSHPLYAAAVACGAADMPPANVSQLRQLHATGCRSVHSLAAAAVEAAAGGAAGQLTAGLTHGQMVCWALEGLHGVLMAACTVIQGVDDISAPALPAMAAAHWAALQAAVPHMPAGQGGAAGHVMLFSSVSELCQNALGGRALAVIALNCPAAVGDPQFLEVMQQVLEPQQRMTPAEQHEAKETLLWAKGLVSHGNNPRLAAALIACGLPARLLQRDEMLRGDLRVMAATLKAAAAGDAAAKNVEETSKLRFGLITWALDSLRQAGQKAAREPQQVSSQSGGRTTSECSNSSSAVGDATPQQQQQQQQWRSELQGALSGLPLLPTAAHVRVASALAVSLPAWERLAAVLLRQWEQPERQAADRLALGQAAAARSCAYLRCANLGLEGGPGAGEGKGCKRCSACRSMYYCSTACSHADWRAGHRRVCKAMDAARLAGAAQTAAAAAPSGGCNA